MDQAKPGFVATVSLKTKAAQFDTRQPEDAREHFWRPIQQQLRRGDTEGATPERLESALLVTIPRALHGMLMGHYQSPAVRHNEWVTSHPHELYAVFFRASMDGYGSALLAVDVGGAKELAALLKGNLDTLAMLMETFVPAAFAAAIPSSFNQDDFAATIAPTAELSRIFAEARERERAVAAPAVGVSGTSTGDTRTDGWLQRAPRALIATAFSLLTPVILSLIVLYCAAQVLMQNQSELARREAAFASKEQALRQAEHAAIAELQKENIELVRILRTPATAVPPKP
jgi:hypothetical protein